VPVQSARASATRPYPSSPSVCPLGSMNHLWAFLALALVGCCARAAAPPNARAARLSGRGLLWDSAAGPETLAIRALSETDNDLEDSGEGDASTEEADGEDGDDGDGDADNEGNDGHGNDSDGDSDDDDGGDDDEDDPDDLVVIELDSAIEYLDTSPNYAITQEQVAAALSDDDDTSDDDDRRPASPPSPPRTPGDDGNSHRDDLHGDGDDDDGAERAGAQALDDFVNTAKQYEEAAEAAAVGGTTAPLAPASQLPAAVSSAAGHRRQLLPSHKWMLFVTARDTKRILRPQEADMLVQLSGRPVSEEELTIIRLVREEQRQEEANARWLHAGIVAFAAATAAALLLGVWRCYKRRCGAPERERLNNVASSSSFPAEKQVQMPPPRADAASFSRG